MTGPIFIPSLHVAVVHFPIALLVGGVLIELFSFLYKTSSFRSAGRWMILLGAISGIPVSICGLQAYHALLTHDNPNASEAWYTMRASAPLPDVARTLLEQHIVVQAIAATLALLVVTFWIGFSDDSRRKFHIPIMLVLLLTVGMVGRGSWLAGEAIYRHQALAKVEISQPTEEKHANADEPKIIQKLHAIEERLPPMELHTFLAGLTIAISFVSIGLAFRQISGFVPVSQPETSRSSDPLQMVRSINPDTMVVQTPAPPAARFWLLSSLLAVLTAAGGIYFTASDSDFFTNAHGSAREFFKLFWGQVRPDASNEMLRQFAHMVGGGVLIVFPLILAFKARLLPRRKLVLSFFSLLLVVVMVAQVWVGMLLMFDTDKGPVIKLNPPATQPASQS